MMDGGLPSIEIDEITSHGTKKVHPDVSHSQANVSSVKYSTTTTGPCFFSENY